MAKKIISGTNQHQDSFITTVARFFSDQRTKYGIGILLLTLTAFLALSFISFFFTGAADDSVINSIIESDKGEITNWTGPTGAYISNFFINKCFGIASFSFLFLTFIIAFRFMRVKLLKIWKAFAFTSILLIWTSVSVSYFFYEFYSDSFIQWGGEHGFVISKWLELNIGSVGTFLLIIASFIVFAIFTYKGTIPFLQKTVEVIISKLKKIFSKKEKEKTIPEKTSTIEEIEEPIESIENIQQMNNEASTKEYEVEEKKKEEDSSMSTWVVTNEGDEEFEITVAEGDDDVTETSTEDITSNGTTMGDYDPTKDLSKYKYPKLSLLKDYGSGDGQVNIDEQTANKDRITTTLSNYGIAIDDIKATVGPTITLYEIVPKAGVRISKIRSLESDIMLSLAATGIRIIAPIPGKGTIGIEVPNNNPQMVSMLSIISSKKFQESKYALPVAFGRTITNDIFMVDLAKMPHMLVAGATGQGKSVGLNAIITSLLYKKHPAELKFVLIDPKKVEFNIYSKIERHFLAKMPDEEEAIITDVSKVVQTLNSLTKEMDERYDLLKTAHVRNLAEYNEKFIKRKLNPEKGHRFLPYIVVIVDEFGDLIMVAGKEVEMPIARIAQLARAVGIHMIIATQRPSVNIITGVIKANFPARVAFRVSSQIDSRTILDATGANQLVGRGDMLFSQGSDLVRVQCAFVDTPEVEEVSDFIGNQRGYPTAFELPEYIAEGSEGSDLSGVDLTKRDTMFEDAARLMVANQQGSTSLIQRKFAIGYNRAGRIMDQLEAAGIVGPFEGSKARQVLIPDDYSLEQKLSTL